MKVSKLEEIVAKFSADTDRRIAENEVAMAKMQADAERQAAESAIRIAEIQRMIEEVRETNEELREMSGRFGLRLGDIVELMVVPGIRPTLSRHGHRYDRVASNRAVRDSEGRSVAEVDLLLDNGTEAMAVEIKTCLATGMVDRHIDRLKKLRANEENADVKGKVLYGAMAGILIDRYVEKYALKNGLYVIEILEDEDRLEVRAPETAARF